MKTRSVEYFRLWEDHTWDTDFIDVSADTSDDKMTGAICFAAAKIEWRDEVPVIVGLYCECNDEEELDIVDD